MKTTSLTYFNYSNAATTMCVSATEYDSPVNGKFWRVRVFEGNDSQLHCPHTRQEAVELADGAVAGFISRLHDVHCAKEA